MNVERNLMTLLAILPVVMLTSCEKIKGKGDVITETRTTGTFTSVNLQMSATIYFVQDTVYKLQISGQENIISQVRTDVDGSQLVVDLKKGVILGSHDPINLYITAPSVTGLTVSGSGDIRASGSLNPGNLSLYISGSGNIDLAAIYTGQLTATISGSGTITAGTGTATREDLKISGSGNIDLRNVVSPIVYTSTSGSGDTYLHATSLLDVNISGSGNVWYYGSPSITMNISGSGNISRL